jgi:taurine dioxygenase
VDLQPLTGVIGAELTGVDLARELAGPAIDDLVAELVASLDVHHVVVLPRQALAPEAQVELSHRFGPPTETPFVATMPDHPEVIRVVKEAEEADAFNFGGAWHSDFSFLARPPSYTLLHAIDVPDWGGDTVFTSMVAALEHLPGDLREMVDHPAVNGVHTARDAYAPKLQALHDGLGHMDIRTDESANATRTHPLVCTHPTSGNRVLFFNQAYVRDLEGVRGLDNADPTSTARCLHRLHDHSTDHRFTVRHRWRNGDLVIWDNRATQHLAVNDYGGRRRELHRTTVEGTVPA